MPYFFSFFHRGILWYGCHLSWLVCTRGSYLWTFALSGSCDQVSLAVFLTIFITSKTDPFFIKWNDPLRYYNHNTIVSINHPLIIYYHPSVQMLSLFWCVKFSIFLGTFFQVGPEKLLALVPFEERRSWGAEVFWWWSGPNGGGYPLVNIQKAMENYHFDR